MRYRMNKLITLLKDKNCIHGEGIEQEIIDNLEQELNLSFSEEYTIYLKTLGIAECNNHEFTGFTKRRRLNVVSATKRNWEYSSLFRRDCYVIEELGIESIVYWQDKEGIIYRSTYNSFEPVYRSLSEYILSWD